MHNIIYVRVPTRIRVGRYNTNSSVLPVLLLNKIGFTCERRES